MARTQNNDLIEVVKLTKGLNADEVIDCYKNKLLPNGETMPAGVKLLCNEYKWDEKRNNKKRIARNFWIVLEIEKGKVALRDNVFVHRDELKEPMRI